MHRTTYAVLIVVALALVGLAPAVSSAASGGQPYYPNGRPGSVHWPTRYGRHGAEFQYLQDRRGHVPTAGKINPLVNAVNQQQALATLSTAGGPWTGLGPNPINHFFGTTATGRVLSEVFDAPLNKLFLGGADGGVWSSTPGGSWTPLTDSLPDLAIGALAVDPRDSTGKTIFAGTGEQAFAGDAFGGVGIYKSTDGGATWKVFGTSVMNGQCVGAIAVDPSNDSLVYAAMVNKTSGSANRGVAVSTDGGQTWSEPSGATSLAGMDVNDLAIDNSGNLYAAVQGQGIYYSNTHGTSWTQINGTGLNTLPGTAGNVYKIALAPSTAGLARSSQVLYTVVGDASTNGLLGVYRSTDGGANWSLVNISSTIMTPNFNQAWYDIYVAVLPTDANTVYVGLVDVFKTTNGLAATPSWTNLTNVYTTGTTGVHPDQHASAFVPGSTAGTGTWYFGNDGGVYSTANGGTSFVDDNGNLALSQFYDGVVGNAQIPTYRLGGLQDNGTVDDNNTNLGTNWNEAGPGGDGFFVALDPNTSSFTTETAYGEYTYGDIYSTPDGWVTNNDIHDSSWSIGTTGPPDALFSAPFEMDPNSATTLYMGRHSLWKTTNANAATPTWTDLNVATNDITAIGISKTSPTTLYVGDAWYNDGSGSHLDNRGHMWVSTTGGSSWGSADGSSTAACTATDSSPTYCPVLGSQATAIAVDPTNGQTLYVTVNSYEGAQRDHVFKSTNGGTTWQDISTSLPDVPFESIAIDPANHNEIFAGSDIGAYVSFDGGATWSALGTGLPNVAVFDLVPNAAGTQLTAFTHGRGAWLIAIPSLSTNVQVPIAAGFNQLDVPQLQTGLSTAASVVSAINGQVGSGAVSFLGKYVNGRFQLYVTNFSGSFNLQPTDGFFVFSTKSGTWTVSGTTPTVGQTITLHRAWNLVAAPFPVGGLLSTTIATEASNGASSCSPQEVALYNTATGTYQVWTPATPTSFLVPASNGFWIECAQAGSMTPS